jgi:multidrug efflux pump subunit AcrB
VDESRRRTFDDVARAYVTSGFNGSRVPLLEVASLRPVWEPSRIVRRNGIRTLTVRSFSAHGHLASAVLAEAMPKIEALKLPAGYRIEYGGELESQNETFAEMVTALMISELLIFLILLIQFRSAKMPLIIMVSIPLSLVGAGLGLMITGNPFSFTAFLGVISLTGVVVRNAIILVDYMNEERRKGIALETAAMEAGRRRLRPIFLTTAAAAAGVLPMIISGSGMWSPLASVIAVGLLCSMVFTLVIVPVLYVLANRGAEKKPVATEFSYPSLPAATPQLTH